MNKYLLETEADGAWRLEKDFSTLSGAVRFAKRFGKFRILDRTTGEILRYSDGQPVPEELDQMLDDLRQEVQRFQAVESWRQQMEVRRREQAQYRQAAVQRQNERRRQWDARRQRLSGFGFVGRTPDLGGYLDDWVRTLEPPVEKVNWLQEGF